MTFERYDAGMQAICNMVWYSWSYIDFIKK